MEYGWESEKTWEVIFVGLDAKHLAKHWSRADHVGSFLDACLAV
jgi:hypothetical protein